MFRMPDFSILRVFEKGWTFEMNILIVGCGKVGSTLAGVLSREGHDVSIIDRYESSFDLLPEDYSGYITVGVPIDQDVLRKAGIENCDAVAAVSRDDNVNIMVCQLAREFFHVGTVIARIYDPKRENVFRHFGLNTICPTNITVDSVKSALLKQELQSVEFECNPVDFHTFPVPKRLIGVHTDEIQGNEQEAVFAVLHADGTMVLTSKTNVVLQATDQLVVAKIIS